MDRRVQAAIDFMEQDLTRPFQLNEVACLVNLSPSRLQHLFKLDTDTSPSRYLKLVKLRRAKELIETTFLSTKQIMVQLGINDESHFVRDFKETYGLPPAHYRRRLPSLEITTTGLAKK